MGEQGLHTSTKVVLRRVRVKFKLKTHSSKLRIDRKLARFIPAGKNVTKIGTQ